MPSAGPAEFRRPPLPGRKDLPSQQQGRLAETNKTLYLGAPACFDWMVGGCAISKLISKYWFVAQHFARVKTDKKSIAHLGHGKRSPAC